MAHSWFAAVAHALIAAAFAPAARGQPSDCNRVEPDCCREAWHAPPSAPPCNAATWFSMGFSDEYKQRTGDPNKDPIYAFHNVNVAMGPAPGDFPPVSQSLTSANCPLVTKAALNARSTPTLAERPTVNGLIDGLTGVPLIRQVDFELPFGGAVFRHVRTYSKQWAQQTTWRNGIASGDYTSLFTSDGGAF